MFRILRRFALLLLALMLPLYAVSLSETLEMPAAWREVRVGDTHPQVRARLRESGLSDQQCEWRPRDASVRCTQVGRHHACGISIRFDGTGGDARVAAVTLHEPIYTGPFHLHARLRRNLR